MMPDLITVEKFFFLLVIYSMIGWIYECIVESIRQKKRMTKSAIF